MYGFLMYELLMYGFLMCGFLMYESLMYGFLMRVTVYFIANYMSLYVAVCVLISCGG